MPVNAVFGLEEYEAGVRRDDFPVVREHVFGFCGATIEVSHEKRLVIVVVFDAYAIDVRNAVALGVGGAVRVHELVSWNRERKTPFGNILDQVFSLEPQIGEIQVRGRCSNRRVVPSGALSRNEHDFDLVHACFDRSRFLGARRKRQAVLVIEQVFAVDVVAVDVEIDDALHADVFGKRAVCVEHRHQKPGAPGPWGHFHRADAEGARGADAFCRGNGRARVEDLDMGVAVNELRVAVLVC